MNRKWIIIIIVAVILTNVIQGVFWFRNKAAAVARYEEQQLQLVSQLQAYGSDVTCYTVKTSVKPGDEITPDNVEPITYPSSYVYDQMVTDANDIYGKLFKVTLMHGTPITYNMTMDDDVRADTRDYDIILDTWPVGLEVGDYIDINITMPYGDRYIVVPYKRVYQVNENSLKVHLTAAELDTYIGAYVDYALNVDYGCTIYATRYVEPGLQDKAAAYYAVPTNIAALIQKNPNIIDKEELGKANEWRSSIEELLTIFRDAEDTVDTDGEKLHKQRDAYIDAIKSDVNTARDMEDTESAEEEEDASTIGWEDTTPGEAQGAMEDSVDDLEGQVTGN